MVWFQSLIHKQGFSVQQQLLGILHCSPEWPHWWCSWSCHPHRSPIHCWGLPPKLHSADEDCPGRCLQRCPMCTELGGWHRRLPCDEAAWDSCHQTQPHNFFHCLQACIQLVGQHRLCIHQFWFQHWQPKINIFVHIKKHEIRLYYYPQTDESKVGSISVWSPLWEVSLSPRSLLDAHSIVTESLDIILVNILASHLIEKQLCPWELVWPVKCPRCPGLWSWLVHVLSLGQVLSIASGFVQPGCWPNQLILIGAGPVKTFNYFR